MWCVCEWVWEGTIANNPPLPTVGRFKTTLCVCVCVCMQVQKETNYTNAECET